MIVYLADKRQFTQDIEAGAVEKSISMMFEAKLNRRVSESEQRSWKNSLQYMYMVLNDDEIPDDSGISVELQIPQTSKRIDFIIAGQDENNNDHAVIVELKQWETAERTSLPGVVKTYLGGRKRNVTHPSHQVYSYAELLKSFNEAVYKDEGINLNPCAYLHNYMGNDVLDHPFYQEDIEKAPVFKQKDHRKLRSFIKKYVKYGDRSDILYRIDNGKIRPSKMLADSLESMLDGNEEFVMIDEQKVAFEYVMNAVEKSTDDKKKVIIVEGGPGTGKSVVAVNLLVKLIGKEYVASYVTKNSAPRQVYISYLTGSMKRSSVENLFRSSGRFMDAESNAFDALIIDEAHRLREKTGLFNDGENQIKELINASKVSVFFIDEDQRIHIKDIGRKEEIKKWADEFNAEVIETELSSQFRCNGSDGYLAWVDHTLQIRDTANPDLSGIEYDFEVYSNPNKLFDKIKEKNKINNKSRVVAGYCWSWESKKDSNTMDIVIPEHGFRKQWNLEDHGQRWLIQPNSIDQVGCIHTCQGLELDYVGVIIGPDLVVRDGKIITDFDERYSYDSSIVGLKKIRKKDPEKASRMADRIIKNTYRTLMTRGMKGCYIYCTDKETEEYFKNAI